MSPERVWNSVVSVLFIVKLYSRCVNVLVSILFSIPLSIILIVQPHQHERNNTTPFLVTSFVDNVPFRQDPEDATGMEPPFLYYYYNRNHFNECREILS